MKKILFPILLLACLRLTGQTLDTIYYNSDWFITTKNNATYYRVGKISNDGAGYVGAFKDYKISGNILLTTGSYDNHYRENEFVEYYETGNIEGQVSSKLSCWLVAVLLS